MQRIRVISSLIAIAAIAACTEPSSTSPARHSPVRDCTEIVYETCGQPPHIDSISPNSSGYTQLDINGHPVSGQFGTFVCVYGRNLSGGSVYLGGSYQASSNSGCGDLVFVAPANDPGSYPVVVANEYGESNAVTFTQH